MADSPRYAIYYAPQSGSTLDRFGAHLLGYDAHGGEELSFPDGMASAVPDWRELTQDRHNCGARTPVAGRPRVEHPAERGIIDGMTAGE